ncbi:homoserine dehydrogenase [Peptoniphilus sp.]|jgi:homoserine dehydrogenase|uniref:homoserine dehydrogenase n=1 Tax=Peptoniphilus sp. TaxID=1971214 RepID=UPI003D8E215F
MKIALIGFGNIGKGVEELIFKNKSKIKNYTGRDISVKTVLINNINKKREPFDKNIIFTDDFNLLLNDDEIDTIVEVTATEDEAFFYLKSAFQKGKNVVTANKAVVSKYFEELFTLSKKYDVKFLYEASVGGGVHIIKSILEDLPFNNITSVRGILNGTCNFILSEMTESGTDYDEALKKAQDLGFAEPDPSADVLGIDTRRKTRILSSLIFNRKVLEKEIFTAGIDKINANDIKVLSEKNYSLKLIGEARYECGKYFSYVMPAAVDENSVFYNINGATNIISFTGDNIKDVSFVGEGAGRYPTSDSILRDLVDISCDNAVSYVHSGEEINLSNSELKSKFYLRLPKDFVNFDIDVVDEKIETCDLHVFTKEIELSEVIDIVRKVESGYYFLAKID